MDDPFPSYCQLLADGRLEARAQAAHEALGNCRLCQPGCGANRLASDAVPLCGIGYRIPLRGHAPCHRDHAVLSGWKGAGRIVFDSPGRPGKSRVAADDLAAMMLELQAHGCHNVSIEAGVACVPQLVTALFLAARQGLRLPLVYASSGQEAPQALALLDGLVDIYRYDVDTPETDAGWEVAEEERMAALREMHRQVGDLVFDGNGLARRGLLVRERLAPGRLGRHLGWLEFIASQLSGATFCHLVSEHDTIPSWLADDGAVLVGAARGYGLWRFDAGSPRAWGVA